MAAEAVDAIATNFGYFRIRTKGLRQLPEAFLSKNETFYYCLEFGMARNSAATASFVLFGVNSWFQFLFKAEPRTKTKTRNKAKDNAHRESTLSPKMLGTLILSVSTIPKFNLQLVLNPCIMWFVNPSLAYQRWCAPSDPGFIDGVLEVREAGEFIGYRSSSEVGIRTQIFAGRPFLRSKLAFDASYQYPQIQRTQGKLSICQ